MCPTGSPGNPAESHTRSIAKYAASARPRHRHVLQNIRRMHRVETSISKRQLRSRRPGRRRIRSPQRQRQRRPRIVKPHIPPAPQRIPALSPTPRQQIKRQLPHRPRPRMPVLQLRHPFKIGPIEFCICHPIYRPNTAPASPHTAGAHPADAPDPSGSAPPPGNQETASALPGPAAHGKNGNSA